jgi:hypothetical protein
MAEALPPDHERRHVRDVELVCHVDIVAGAMDAIHEAGSLYAWAGDRPQPRALRGRAPVYVATLPGTRHTIAVRHAWHGGLLAPITGDRWLRPGRAAIELRKSIALNKAGIATAPVLGYALYPTAGVFVRVDVISRFVENSWDLGAVLSDLAPGTSREDALAATRRLLVQLAAHRLLHPDLNVKNILLRHRAASVDALVIDVDVMQLDIRRTPEQVMRGNAERLLRSMRKWSRQSGTHLDEGLLLSLRRELIESTPSAAATTADLAAAWRSR